MTPEKQNAIWNLPRQSFKEMKHETKPALPERAQTKRVLLVDDDALSTELFLAQTREWNYEHDAAKSVADAMQLLGSPGEYALAILDVVLINGSGVDLYRWIASNRPRMNVAFLTNFEVDPIEAEVRLIGPAFVFPKTMLGDPAFIEQLMLRVGIGRKVI